MFEICLYFGKAIVGVVPLCFMESQATQHAGLPVADESSKWQDGARFIRFSVRVIFGKHLPNRFASPHPTA
jgi:hypothetical protein